MHSRYIQSFTAFFLDPDNEQETLPPFAASLPKRATRRMSRLGILLCSALDGLPVDSDLVKLRRQA